MIIILWLIFITLSFVFYFESKKQMRRGAMIVFSLAVAIFLPLVSSVTIHGIFYFELLSFDHIAVYYALCYGIPVVMFVAFQLILYSHKILE